jgi:hypothetical protein
MRRMWGQRAVAGLLLAALTACGTPTDDNAHDGDDPVVVQFLSDTRAARTVHVTGVLKRSNPDGAPAFRIEGAFDFERDVSSLRVTVDLGKRRGLTNEYRSHGNVTFASVDSRATPFNDELRRYRWVMSRNDRDRRISSRFATLSPFEVLDDLAGSAKVTERGQEVVGGVATTFYDVEWDRDAYARRLGVSAGSIVDRALQARIWVDDAGRLRRFRHTFATEMTYDFGRYGEAVDVDLPSGDDVYDATREPALDMPDVTRPGPWEHVAQGTFQESTWSLWRTVVGDGWSCWSFEAVPELNAGLDVDYQEFTVNGVRIDPPRHNGHDANCTRDPGLGLLSPPVGIVEYSFSSSGDEGTQVLVGVAVAGATTASLMLADQSTQTIPIDPGTHVFAWMANSAHQVVELRVPLPNGRVGVCGSSTQDDPSLPVGISSFCRSERRVP